MAEQEQKLIQEICALAAQKQPVLVAIDGRCASGKTSLAARLAQQLCCRVIPMDDFFLQPYQQTPERRALGNVDYERFLREVAPQLKGVQDVTYRPYSCRIRALTPPVTLSANPITIVEGSYSCHPALRELYDVRVFLTISPKMQRERITARNGEEGAKRFQELWIPLEEEYFAKYQVEDACDWVMRNDTDGTAAGIPAL